MPQVEVSINNRGYRIACDEGQDEHLQRLAEYVDKRVQELAAAVGQVGDARLLVMASLLIADELSETYASLQENGEPAASVGDDEKLAQITEEIAERIEKIAAKLEAA